LETVSDPWTHDEIKPAVQLQHLLSPLLPSQLLPGMQCSNKGRCPFLWFL
jgi:hypothetical protein